ncbi:MAG: hypothetical protein HQL32_15500 [Planctomycetes bacterium]|nr:hypothetical protein [Planctomycetota bacterium]
MKRFLVALFIGLVIGGVYLFSQDYPDSAPEVLGTYGEKVTQKMTVFLEKPITSELSQKLGLYSFLQSSKGMASSLGFSVAFAVFILLMVLCNILGFFKDFFAFFPLGK